MKKFIQVVLFVSGIVLVGCGGGGGNGDSSSSSLSSTSALVYEGKTTVAKLDVGSAKSFVEFILDTSNNSSITSNTSTTNKLSKSFQKQSKVINGATGTLDFTTTTIDNVTTKIVAVFNNYSESYEDSLVDFGGFDFASPQLTGTIIYLITVDESSSDVINNMEMTLTLLNEKTSTSDVTMDGVLNVSIDPTVGESTFTQNLLIQNNKSSESFKLENFIIVFDTNNRPLSYSGKLYNSSEGYVVISTPIKLSYEGGSQIPSAGGEVFFEGDNTIVRERIAYDGSVRVEIDNDKDGTVDEFEVYNMDTLEVVQNRKPVVEITFPKEIFTNTELSRVKVNSYDPDLDEITSTSEWKVNDVFKSNSLSLDNDLFKKHDSLKLTVVAEDNRVGDIKITRVIKEQEVLNSRPVPVLELDKTEIEIGGKIIIDASASYDIDNDEFLFIWTTQNRRYNIHDEIYNSRMDYLEMNETNKSKIVFHGEEINYDRFKDIADYGINLKLDDQDIDGTSDINSSNIRVISQDLFDRKVTLLKDLGITTDEIVAISLGNLNNDSLKDIVLITEINGDNSGVDRLVILFQNKIGEFKDTFKISLAPEDVYTYDYKSIDIADMNSDGLKDISIATGHHSKFITYYQGSDGVFSMKKEYVTKTFPYYIEPRTLIKPDYIAYNVEYLKSVDINNDGKLDMVTVGHNYQADIDMGIDIFIQNENNLTDEKIIPIGDTEAPYKDYKIDRVQVDDIDNNGFNDILMSNYILYQEDNGSFTEKYFNEAFHLSSSDMDNDGVVELIGINKTNDELTILKSDNNLSRNYTEQIEKSITASNSSQVEIKDMNQDNKKDIIIGHEASPYFTLFIQDKNAYLGNQLYRMDSNLSFRYFSNSLIVADVNNNGKNDVIMFGRKGFELFYVK